MKRLIKIVISLLALFCLSFGITYFTHTQLIDYAFLIGLAVTILFWFFTSKGGVTSDNLDVIVQSTTGIKIEQKRQIEFEPNLFFYTSLGYTIISFIIFLIHNRKYI